MHEPNESAPFVSATNATISPERDSSQRHPANKRIPCVELFVGDLSYFCEERDLIALFSPFGQIVEAVVCRSENKGHSLLHGFVKIDTLANAEVAAAALNETSFMGRTLRVQICSLGGATRIKLSRGGFHVHLSFAADLSVETINEGKLRTIASRFGKILDVIIKRHSRMKNPPRQKGYGFIYFSSKCDAEQAVIGMHGTVCDQIFLECELSRRPVELRGDVPNTDNPSQKFNRHQQQNHAVDNRSRASIPARMNNSQLVDDFSGQNAVQWSPTHMLSSGFATNQATFRVPYQQQPPTVPGLSWNCYGYYPPRMITPPTPMQSPVFLGAYNENGIPLVAYPSVHLYAPDGLVPNQSVGPLYHPIYDTDNFGFPY